MKEQEASANVADIVSTMVSMNRGNFVIECGRKLDELSRAIVDTGGKGKLTIVLEVTPSGMKDGRVNQFEIRPNVAINKPEHPQGKSIFFVTEDCKLTRDDPDQLEMSYEMPERETNGRR